MKRQDQFERIVASLYADMADDARRPAVSRLIDEFCGAKSNYLVFGDGAAPDDIDIFFAQFCSRGQRCVELEREYFGTWHAVDERLPRIRALPDGRLAANEALLSETEMKTASMWRSALWSRGVVVVPDGIKIA